MRPTPGGWLRQRTARSARRPGGRRLPAGRSAPLPAASVLELAPRARHAVWRCIPCDAHPAPSRPPRRRRETEAVTKPHGEAPPPDTRARSLLSRVCPANPRYRGNRLPAPPAAAESAWERPPPVGRGHHSEARPRPPGLFLFRDAAPSSPSPAGTRVSPVPVDRITAAAHQPPRLPPSRRPPQAGARAHKESDRDGALGFSRRSARRRAARRDKTRVSRCLARARAPQRPLGEGPFAARLLLPLPGFSPRGGQTTQAQLPVDPRPSSVPGTAVNTSAREEWACVDV